MKIAFLTTDNRENYRRYDVPAPYFGTAPAALLQGLAALTEVEVHVISCTQHSMRSPEKLAENTWFHSLLVPKIGWLRTGYQGCVRAIRQKLKELQPDVVHGQGTERDNGLAAIFSGFPNVITIHGNMRSVAEVNEARPFSYLWCAAILERLTLPRTDGVVCITRYTQAAVEALAKRTWLVPNAVDGSFFEIRRTPPVIPRLLCVGAICLRKNQNFLIRALDVVAAEAPFELLFLGEASDRDDYGREFHDLLRSRPWCRHLGFVDQQGVQKWLSGATALVLPSLEDNCPMAVLEAAAASVPVAAARVGGVPDLIEDQRNGLLFDPRDEFSMAAAVRRLLVEPETAAKIAATAHADALSRFLPSVVARRHLEIYREVIG